MAASFRFDPCPSCCELPPCDDLFSSLGDYTNDAHARVSVSGVTAIDCSAGNCADFSTPTDLAYYTKAQFAPPSPCYIYYRWLDTTTSFCGAVARRELGFSIWRDATQFRYEVGCDIKRVSDFQMNWNWLFRYTTTSLVPTSDFGSIPWTLISCNVWGGSFPLPSWKCNCPTGVSVLWIP